MNTSHRNAKHEEKTDAASQYSLLPPCSESVTTRSDEQYFNAFDRVLERLVQYKPDFLLFSAGFDAHKDDPLAQFQLNSKDFYEITKRTLTATNKFTAGKVVSILEGGYDLNALAESANEHVNALVEFN